MAESQSTPWSPTPRRPRRGGSLRRRLALITSIFLVAIVGGGGTAAYFKVREAVLDAARGRLQGNARQWGRLLAQSMTGRAEEARRAAARPAFQRRLVAADAAAVAAAQEQAKAVWDRRRLLNVELWSASGERLTAAVAPPSPDGLVWPPNQPAEAPRSTGLRPLLAHGDLLHSELVVDVAAPEATEPASRGFLLIVGGRRTAAGRALAGDRRGRLAAHRSRESGCGRTWHVVYGPLAPRRRHRAVSRVERRGLARHRSGDRRDPLTLWVETPEAVALAPAYAFCNAMLPIGGLFVVLGALLAWIVGRRITNRCPS